MTFVQLIDLPSKICYRSLKCSLFKSLTLIFIQLIWLCMTHIWYVSLTNIYVSKWNNGNWTCIWYLYTASYKLFVHFDFAWEVKHMSIQVCLSSSNKLYTLELKNYRVFFKKHFESYYPTRREWVLFINQWKILPKVWGWKCLFLGWAKLIFQ